MRKLKITELNRISVEEFKSSEKIPLVIVLDNVRSQHNIGSVFRTGDAFLVESLYLCGITSTPPNAEIHKTALGAEYSVDWKYFAESTQAVKELQQKGYTVFAIEQVQNSILLPDLQLDKTRKYAVVLGNEVKGVQQQVIDLCDASIEIPQFGTKHSLNVSITGGIIIWEFFQKMQSFSFV